jgi:antitoxin MazE6
MKTAISIPDKVFDSAEKLANRLGKTRSQLYTQALSNYIAKHKTDDVTNKLDEVYASEESVPDGGLNTLQYLSLPKEKW